MVVKVYPKGRLIVGPTNNNTTVVGVRKECKAQTMANHALITIFPFLSIGKEMSWYFRTPGAAHSTELVFKFDDRVILSNVSV